MEKFIYAIVASPAGNAEITSLIREIRGISGSAMYALTERDVSAVIGDFSPSKNTMNNDLAIDFARVIEELSHKVTLLPVRFGTVVKSDEVVLQLLISHYDAFLKNLQEVDNKYEFGLKVLWDYDRCSEKIRMKENPENVESGKYFKQSTIHTNYLLEKIRKHRMEDAVLKHVEQLTEEIIRHLAQIDPYSKFRKMVSHNIIIDAVFLVEKNLKDEFVEAIEVLIQQHGDLQFILTGPWPPYSFSEFNAV